MSLLEVFAGALGRVAGQAVSHSMAALFVVLFVLLIWVLPWSSIISKAGYKGKMHRVLTLMMSSPIALMPLSDSNSEFAQFCVGLAGISFFLVIWFLALFPWRPVKPSSDRL